MITTAIMNFFDHFQQFLAINQTINQTTCKAMSTTGLESFALNLLRGRRKEGTKGGAKQGRKEGRKEGRRKEGR